ncbi:MAG TPA: 30S ribosomal protein S17 [Patescibacteria group bacterium]|nr:30S ribosomal protein S17 [Patescibacteria group bacterium]
MENNNKTVSAKKKGIVVSDKMDKTIIVAVSEFKTHPKYRKKYKSTKKYKVHDQENKYKTGDVVEIVPARPMSKDKFYKVL